MEEQFMSIDLSEFDDEFSRVVVEDREYEPVPDATYQVVVDRVELTTARSSGNPMLRWTLRILGPRHEGRLLWRHNLIVTKENLKWLKSDLHICGLDLQKLSELGRHLDRLLDVKLEVKKVTRGENENVYLNRRIETEDGGDVASGMDSYF